MFPSHLHDHQLNYRSTFFCYGISSIREHSINSIISFYRFGKRGRLPYFDMEDLPLHPQVCFFPFSNLKIDINHVTFYCCLKKSSTFIKSDGKVGKPRTRFSTLFRLSSSEWIRRKLLADSKQPTKRRGEKLSEKWWKKLYIKYYLCCVFGKKFRFLSCLSFFFF